jgi:hypothetical protein
MSGDIFNGLNFLNCVDLSSNECIGEKFSNPSEIATMKEVVNEKCESLVRSIYFSINPRDRYINLNWFNVKPFRNMVVVMTDKLMVEVNTHLKNELHHGNNLVGNIEIKKSEDATYFYELGINEPDGTEELEFQHDFSKELQPDSKGCYNFWWYLVDGNTVIDSGCMRTRSRWMNDMKPTLTNRKINQVFFPGTHDSVSFKEGITLNTASFPLNSYSLTQDDTVKSQLDHGIRYLDIRVAYYQPFPTSETTRFSSKTFWGVHGPVWMHPITQIFEQVRDFVDANTEEIVILDFHQFKDFDNDEVHTKFLELLKQWFKFYAANPESGWETTLGDIWKTQTRNRIIISYNKKDFAQNEGKGFLWPRIEQQWGEIRSGSTNLIAYLKESRLKTMKQENSEPFAEMAELTPNAKSIFVSESGGDLRKMADDVNLDVTKLYHGEFGRNANIVAVDFYRSTNIVDIAIDWNKNKMNRRDQPTFQMRTFRTTDVKLPHSKIVVKDRPKEDLL